MDPSDPAETNLAEENPYLAQAHVEDLRQVSPAKWLAAQSAASAVKVEFWGVILTVLTVVAMYATLVQFFVLGPQARAWLPEQIYPFLLGIVAGQAISLTARVSTFAACVTLRILPAWFAAVGILALGELILAINAVIPLVVMTQLLGVVLIFIGQPLMVVVWMLIASKLGIDSLRRVGRWIISLSVITLILLSVPRLVRLDAVVNWVAIPILLIVFMTIVLYVILLITLRAELQKLVK